MGSMFRKVDCVGVRVTDLEEAIEFYSSSLGHRVTWKTEDAAGLSIPQSEAELVLHTEDWKVETGLLVDSVPAAVERFTNAGGQLIDRPFETQIGLGALLSDPWGNQLLILDLSKGALTVDEKGRVIGNS